MPKARINIKSRTSRRSLPVSPKLYIEAVTGEPKLAVGYRRGKRGGTWTARYHDGGMKYTFHPIGAADDSGQADGTNIFSFEDAVLKAKQWQTRKTAEDSGEVKAGPYTVADAISDYLQHLEKSKRKPQYRTKIVADAFIVPALGQIQLAKLTHTKVWTWFHAVPETAPRKRTCVGKEQAFRKFDPNDPEAIRKRQATANRVLTVLKAALNHAKTNLRRIDTDKAWVDVTPFRRVGVAKIRFLTNDEVTKLVNACTPDFELLVKGALLTGCRYGELSAMTVENFNEDDGQVFVAQSKNGESRHVDLNAGGIAFFRQLTNERKPTETLFLKSNGKPWNMSEQKRPMDDACEAAHIHGVTFHILRHTYASHALMDGMTIEVLAQQLGHK